MRRGGAPILHCAARYQNYSHSFLELSIAGSGLLWKCLAVVLLSTSSALSLCKLASESLGNNAGLRVMEFFERVLVLDAIIICERKYCTKPLKFVI